MDMKMYTVCMILSLCVCVCVCVCVLYGLGGVIIIICFM